MLLYTAYVVNKSTNVLILHCSTIRGKTFIVLYALVFMTKHELIDRLKLKYNYLLSFAYHKQKKEKMF